MYHIILNLTEHILLVKLYAHNFQYASIQIIYKNYLTSMMQPRFRMAHPRVIFIHCIYLAKLDKEFETADTAQLVEFWTGDLEIAGSSLL